MKLDILVLAAHPDDAELSCSGTIARHVAQGKKVGIVDFTKGEMGTRGTPQLRMEEAAAAAKVLGLSARENLGFSDVFYTNDKEHQLEVAKMVRKYQPEIVLANAVDDRHPDHGKGARLATDACFISGLAKVETRLEGEIQQAWRPSKVFHYVQSKYIEPDFVVDISDFWETKVASIKAFQSQFFVGDKSTEGAQTFISTPKFMKFIESRAREYGQLGGVEYAEGFTKELPLVMKDLFDFV
ncbi:bacillithiol biosynthesis deacetylase BshB1 [Flammeovirgaceae bacterium SG7u.111]|nr:bacillithiol biosynthesis deacetylase BshB1 [Flammeovirgaceae bacterium SG7u.132]WPO34770.1 bacillithiol biosynthesis deacetylase BshB1 [Flammeovirgaceae bacterium SG7u.111]